MALAELERVPMRYLVDVALLTVTFCPAAVNIEKLDLDTLPTVPTDPPAAGPDRALEFPLPGTRCPDIAEVDDDDAAAVVVAVFEPILAVALTMP
jgi:hypothetical protein